MLPDFFAIILPPELRSNGWPRDNVWQRSVVGLFRRPPYHHRRRLDLQDFGLIMKIERLISYRACRRESGIIRIARLVAPARRRGQQISAPLELHSVSEIKDSIGSGPVT